MNNEFYHYLKMRFDTFLLTLFFDSINTYIFSRHPFHGPFTISDLRNHFVDILHQLNIKHSSVSTYHRLSGVKSSNITKGKYLLT
jgi:hypothetical protein